MTFNTQKKIAKNELNTDCFGVDNQNTNHLLQQKLSQLKTTNQLNLNLDFLLVMVLIMRVLPSRWIYDLEKKYNVKRRQIYNLVGSACSSNLLTKKEDITGEKLLYLTEKGFYRANRFVGVAYQYRRWTKTAIRTGSIYQEHHYILFRFFLDYFNQFRVADTILTDYDKQCLLEYAGGKDAIIRPDGMIRPDGQDYYNLICIEADTGSKTQGVLFDKFLRYFLFANHNFNNEPIQKIQIYFSFKSFNRLESVFNIDKQKNKGSLFKNFKNPTLKFQQSKINKHLNFEQVNKILKEKKVRFTLVFLVNIGQILKRLIFWIWFIQLI